MRCLLAILVLAQIGARRAEVPGYHVHRALPAHVSGVALRVELLEDDRLTPKTRSAVTAAYSSGRQPCEERTPATIGFCTAIAAGALRPAFVRLVSVTGKEIGRLSLERATAELSPLVLTRRDTALSVMVDLSADAGSYSGPLVRFLSIGRHKVRWASVIDDATGDSSELDLPTTLKTGWRVSPRASRPEILLVACRPSLDGSADPTGDLPFIVTYSRLYLDGAAWHRADRRVKGCWENDGDFPARALFP